MEFQFGSQRMAISLTSWGGAGLAIVDPHAEWWRATWSSTLHVPWDFHNVLAINFQERLCWLPFFVPPRCFHMFLLSIHRCRTKVCLHRLSTRRKPLVDAMIGWLVGGFEVNRSPSSPGALVFFDNWLMKIEGVFSRVRFPLSSWRRWSQSSEMYWNVNLGQHPPMRHPIDLQWSTSSKLMFS